MGVIFFMLSFGKSVGKTRFFDFIRCLIAAGHSLNGRFKISTPTDQIRLAQYLHKGPSITPKKLVYRLVHGEQQDDDDSDEEIDTSMLPEEGEPAPNKSEKKNAQKKAKKGKPKTYLPKLESFSTSGFMTHVSKTNLCRSPIVVQDEGRMFWQKTLGTPNPENETNAFVSTVYSTGHFEKTQGIEKYCYDVPFCNLSAWVPVHADYVLSCMGPRMQDHDPTGVCIRGFWLLLEPRNIEKPDDEEVPDAEATGKPKKAKVAEGKGEPAPEQEQKKKPTKLEKALSQVTANLATIWRHYDDVVKPSEPQPAPRVLKLNKESFDIMQETIDTFMADHQGEEHITDAVGKLSNLASRLAAMAHFTFMALKPTTTKKFDDVIDETAAAFGLQLALWSTENFLRMRHGSTTDKTNFAPAQSAGASGTTDTKTATICLPYSPETNALLSRVVRSKSEKISDATFLYKDLKSSLGRIRVDYLDGTTKYMDVPASVWRAKFEKLGDEGGIEYNASSNGIRLVEGLSPELQAITAKRHLDAIANRPEGAGELLGLNLGAPSSSSKATASASANRPTIDFDGSNQENIFSQPSDLVKSLAQQSQAQPQGGTTDTGDEVLDEAEGDEEKVGEEESEVKKNKKSAKGSMKTLKR